MNPNVDHEEVNKFAAIADSWWDPTGDFKPLHVINPLRANYINQTISLNGLKVLDVGCGGGLLAEAFESMGASVTAIDVTEANIEVAKLHAKKTGKTISYMMMRAEDLAIKEPESFDVVACLEVIEHVPDPGQLIDACAKLLKPKGEMFLSTLNRNPRSFVTAILGAEYIFNILPKGTHEWSKFIKPAELENICEPLRLSSKKVKACFIIQSFIQLN